MTERVWHKGPPPHVGWWNASTVCDDDAWRWWDGIRWSNATWANKSSTAARNTAKTKAFGSIQGEVEWTHYYPENARVPRIAP